jgi:hypothetical protein
MCVTRKCQVTYFAGIGVDRSGRSLLLLLAVVSYHGAEDDGGVRVLVPIQISGVVFSVCVDTPCAVVWWFEVVGVLLVVFFCPVVEQWNSGTVETELSLYGEVNKLYHALVLHLFKLR